MGKRKNKGRRIVRKRVNPAGQLIKEHNRVYKKAVDFINTTATIALQLLVEASFNELYMNSACESRFSMHEEYLGRAYSQVMDGYSSIISYYNMHDAEIDSYGKNKLAGIRTILYTRLSEYKKISPDSFETGKTGQSDEYLLNFSNKIREIILKKFSKVLESIAPNYTVHMWNLATAKASEVLEDIKADIMREFSEDFFETYKTFTGQVKVSSENARVTAKLNFERIKQEYDILGVIVKVQAPELEARSEGYGPVNRVLDMIRSEYERLGSDINHIEALHNQANQEIDAEGDDFYKFMGRVLVFLNSKDALAVNLDKFVCEYVFVLDDYDEGVRAYWRELCNERPQQSQSMVKAKEESLLRTETLAGGITSEFAFALSGIGQNMELCKDDSGVYQVVLGIHETLSMKMSSMNEMYGEYLENMKAFSDNELSLAYDSDKDIEDALAEYKLTFYSFFDDVSKSLKEADRFYKQRIEKAKEKSLRATEKVWDDGIKAIKNMEFRFRKECLFFEIVTFEEIISYSVLKLKDSELEAAKSCCRFIVEAAANIKKILEICGIEIIEPEIGEMFNGRLHEVIMAKEEEGFVRGEITKVLSKGYREGAVVFARANVICAK